MAGRQHPLRNFGRSLSCPDVFSQPPSGFVYSTASEHHEWVDGLLCAYELVAPIEPSHTWDEAYHLSLIAEDVKKEQNQAQSSLQQGAEDDLLVPDDVAERFSKYENTGQSPQPPTESQQNVPLNSRSQWVPIGWSRIKEIVSGLASVREARHTWNADEFESSDSASTRTGAPGDNLGGKATLKQQYGLESPAPPLTPVAAPVSMSTPPAEKLLPAAKVWATKSMPPSGPIWWAHLDAAHPNVVSWLALAPWLHPAISAALRDESRLISDRMKHLLYEVPVRVAGGLLFELLGQSAGDPDLLEGDVPVVLRSWLTGSCLLTALHVKGEVSSLAVLGVEDVQDMIASQGPDSPDYLHELVALITNRLASWDDRLFRKNVFGAADEVELKFVNRRGNNELKLLAIIINGEIQRLSNQTIRVKWSLHAREEIVYELMEALQGARSRELLKETRRDTREMLSEQEAVRDRLFNLQDVMQSNLRAWLQDKSLRVQHNLAVVGGGGLLLSIMTGLFGVNLDGIPGVTDSGHPAAFGVFSACLFVLGALIVGLGLWFGGMEHPPTERELNLRQMELQDLVRMFQRAAEGHEGVGSSGKANWRTSRTPGRVVQVAFPQNPDLSAGEYLLMGHQ